MIPLTILYDEYIDRLKLTEQKEPSCVYSSSLPTKVGVGTMMYTMFFFSILRLVVISFMLFPIASTTAKFLFSLHFRELLNSACNIFLAKNEFVVYATRSLPYFFQFIFHEMQ